ncbi:MAG: STAS domain-containing protein [Bradyrhizobium sp.]|uniref:STAS domain-containing protein n=1 Tax=Bradyrhizobium sp. TaxID=376 RepID=UPI001DF37AC7|nr:STAS domain-containing protein [Bradyrhizobium sp.]MBV9561027.1 STAS domain-containing protein [Bradyrhizobium sp.]
MTSTTPPETAADDAAAGQVHALPEMLDLAQAESLRKGMLNLLQRRDILLDASAVQRMSTPCVQILLAAGRSAQAVQKPYKITNASDVFRAAIADLGLQSEFSNWMN